MSPEEMVGKCIEYIENMPYDEWTCFYIVLAQAVGPEAANECERNGLIWKLMRDFFKECDKRKILLKHHNSYGMPEGLPYNMGFCKVKELIDDPDEAIAKLIFKKFKNYPFYKRTSIYELIHETYKNDEAEQLLKEMGWQIGWWFNNFAQNNRSFEIAVPDLHNDICGEFDSVIECFWKVPKPSRRFRISNKGVKKVTFDIDCGYFAQTQEILVLENDKLSYSKEPRGPKMHFFEDEDIPAHIKERYTPKKINVTVDNYFDNPLVIKALSLLECNKPLNERVLDGPSCEITIEYNNGKKKECGFMFMNSISHRDIPFRNMANYLLNTFPQDLPVPFLFDHQAEYDIDETVLDEAINALENGYKTNTIKISEVTEVIERPKWLEDVMFGLLEHIPFIPDCLTLDLWTREEEKKLGFCDICTLMSWFVWLDCTNEIVIIKSIIDDGRLLYWLKTLKELRTSDDEE